MTESQDPVAVFERVRELEAEIASLVRGLDRETAIREEDAEFTVLEVEVDESTYLIPIDQAREVVSMAWPEVVVGAPSWVMGTVSFGSQPATLIDMAERLHGHATKLSSELLMVILEGARWLGLVVTDVGNLREINANDLTTPGSELPCAEFLLGTVCDDEGRTLPVLSTRRLGHDIHG